MTGLTIKFDRAGAGKHVARWKKRMDATIRRAVKASRRAIYMANNSGTPYKAARVALKAKKDVLKAAKGL